MTAFIPTTRVTIQRGALAPNSFGDELPAATVIATGVPAAVTEGLGSSTANNTQTSFQPDAMRLGVVELFTVRLRPGTDVVEDDRLVDERTGAVYQVRSVYNPQSVVGLTDIRLAAVRTGATSQAVNA